MSFRIKRYNNKVNSGAEYTCVEIKFSVQPLPVFTARKCINAQKTCMNNIICSRRNITM